MNNMKKIGTTAASVVLWAIILLAGLYTFTTLATKDVGHVARLFGYTPMVVQTDSMKPTFSQGDLIIIRKCDPKQLQVGDIITFHTIIMNQYALNTHRISNIEEFDGYRSYTTHGDNNLIDDTHVISDGDIVGKYVTKFAGVGRVVDFLSSSIGLLVVIVLPMLLFLIYQIYHLVCVSIDLRRALRAENAQAEAQQLAKADTMAEANAALAEAQKMREEAERLRREAEEALRQAKENKE